MNAIFNMLFHKNILEELILKNLYEESVFWLKEDEFLKTENLEFMIGMKIIVGHRNGFCTAR